MRAAGADKGGCTRYLGKAMAIDIGGDEIGVEERRSAATSTTLPNDEMAIDGRLNV